MELSYYKKFEPIDGKWYITRELGSGAFGTVFEVERKDEPDMKSAIKAISIPPTQNEVRSYMNDNYDFDEQSVSAYFYGFVEEFKKEILVMSRLRGYTNIVSYEDHEIIQKEDGIGWDIFIRMELLTPLNEHYKSNPPVQKDVIKLGIDICRALEICQNYNIVHRDIKPANIFVSKTGDYKLGDFGVARTLEKTSSGLSKKGTYTYMAPEVCKNEEYSSNVDIYSLGMVMYKLLNGNMEPFRTQRTPQDEENALGRRLKGEIIPPPANAGDCLAKIILRAISFNPKDRYAGPTQMREELEAALSEEKSEGIICDYMDKKEPSHNESTRGIFSDDRTRGVFEALEDDLHIEPDVTADENAEEHGESTETNTDWSSVVIVIGLIAIILLILIGASVNNNSEDNIEQINYAQSYTADEILGEWEVVGVISYGGEINYYESPTGKWIFYDDGTYMQESYETGEVLWRDYEIKGNNEYTTFVAPYLDGELQKTWYKIDWRNDELILPAYLCEYSSDTDSYSYKFTGDSETIILRRIQ